MEGIKPDNIIFECIVGSQAYGTAIPTSDVDIKGVYIQPIDDLISFGYREQWNVDKDTTYYEVGRFLQLLQTANPTVLEMLWVPNECILQTSPTWDIIKEHRSMFVTKACRNSFAGYVVSQIKKARGLDKKMNWEANKVTRKTPLDFCYIAVSPAKGFFSRLFGLPSNERKTFPIKKWLDNTPYIQDQLGLAALDHMRDMYAVFINADPEMPLRGIVSEDGNEVRLSSIPKDALFLTDMYYNKDGYSEHCKAYKEYQEWLSKRNTQRYVDVNAHGQQIDGKNMMHCRRLLDTARDIATTGEILVRRPNAEYLLSIRRGEVDLKQLLDSAEADLVEIDAEFDNCSLPSSADFEETRQLLLKVRKFYYNTDATRQLTEPSDTLLEHKDTSHERVAGCTEIDTNS